MVGRLFIRVLSYLAQTLTAPPSVPAAAEFEEVSIWDALSASKEHTVLTETLDFLGLAEVLGETNLTLTLLSPTDLAFDIFFKALGLEGK